MILSNKRVYIKLVSNVALEERDVQLLNLVGASFNQAIVDYCRTKNKKRIRSDCQTADEIKREILTCELYKTMAEMTQYTVEELFNNAVEEYSRSHWRWKVHT